MTYPLLVNVARTALVFVSLAACADANALSKACNKGSIGAFCLGQPQTYNLCAPRAAAARPK